MANSRTQLIFATTCFYAASSTPAVVALLKLGQSGAILVGTATVLATTISYLALAGMHFRVSAATKPGQRRLETCASLLVGLAISLALWPIVDYYITTRGIPIASGLVIIWAYSLLMSNVVFYYLISAGSNSSAAILRIMSSLPPTAVATLWLFYDIKLAGGLATLAIITFTVAVTHLTIWIEMPGLFSVFREAALSLLRDDVKRHIYQNIYLTIVALISSSLILLLPPQSKEEAQYIFIYFGSRVIAAALQGYCNPVSQWFTRDLGAILETQGPRQPDSIKNLIGTVLKRLAIAEVVIIFCCSILYLIIDDVLAKPEGLAAVAAVFIIAATLQVFTSPFSPALNVYGYRGALIKFENVRLVVSLIAVLSIENYGNSYIWWYGLQAFNYFLLGMLSNRCFKRMAKNHD